MCALLEHRLLFRVFHVDLRAFQDLERYGTVGIVCQERASARLAYILHHAAHTHRTVQLLAQVNDQVGIFHILDVFLAATQLLLYETDDVFQLFVAVMPAIQQFQVIECLLLKGYQYTGKQFLIRNGIGFQAVRDHIVDVLDEHDVGIQVVQVLNQCPMTARTEEQLALIVAERLVLHVGCNRIGAGLLLGERNVVLHAVLLCVFAHFGINQLLEKRTVFCRYGEMHIHLTRLPCGIKRTFHQVFFQRCTYPVGIAVELQQAFRKRTVIQSGSFKQVRHYSLVIMLRQQGIDVLARVIQTSRIQVIVESEIVNVVEEFLFEIGRGHIIIRSQELEHILKHTACRSRCRNKLHHLPVAVLVSIPCSQVFLLHVFVCYHNAVILYGCGSRQTQKRKTFFETSQLLFNLLLGNSFLFQQFFVFVC